MRLPFFNRPSTKNNTPVEDGLTEDPERQRARHRLIGAIFLVTVAVAGLPIIFDSKPKQYNNDIAIQIIQPGAKEEKKSDPKPEEARTETAAANKDTKKEESKSDKPAPVAKTLDKGEEVLSILEDRKSTPAANTGHSGKYIVQIGAFASEDRVKNWQKKLNEQKVSTYVDVRPGKDGGKLHLLRSGPYGDRAAAEAAEKKIKYVGLSPKIIEQKSE
ncbi:SPOR domain-containing protein [Polynucleobacter victoriensis]|uniref:DedD protein n=1 Tax=Polynucleobacter victoriensis TaxID=2049319 RepID=A0A212U0M6_9BURK|nr:SPOR domain-containing protein [Polynucleobacter victoriensis]SNC71798.1 DedD protein [Polynucleobacter victoriensis]